MEQQNKNPEPMCTYVCGSSLYAPKSVTGNRQWDTWDIKLSVVQAAELMKEPRHAQEITALGVPVPRWFSKSNISERLLACWLIFTGTYITPTLQVQAKRFVFAQWNNRGREIPWESRKLQEAIQIFPRYFWHDRFTVPHKTGHRRCFWVRGATHNRVAVELDTWQALL